MLLMLDENVAAQDLPPPAISAAASRSSEFDDRDWDSPFVAAFIPLRPPWLILSQPLRHSDPVVTSPALLEAMAQQDRLASLFSEPAPPVVPVSRAYDSKSLAAKLRPSQAFTATARPTRTVRRLPYAFSR